MKPYLHEKNRPRQAQPSYKVKISLTSRMIKAVVRNDFIVTVFVPSFLRSLNNYQYTQYNHFCSGRALTLLVFVQEIGRRNLDFSLCQERSFSDTIFKEYSLALI